jgi:hypothetical protein
MRKCSRSSAVPRSMPSGWFQRRTTAGRQRQLCFLVVAKDVKTRKSSPNLGTRKIHAMIVILEGCGTLVVEIEVVACSRSDACRAIMYVSRGPTLRGQDEVRGVTIA